MLFENVSIYVPNLVTITFFELRIFFVDSKFEVFYVEGFFL